MINVTLLWMLLVPIILSALTVYVLPKVTKGQIPYFHAAGFAVLGLFISFLILAGAFYAGIGSKTADTEIWNGEVTGKTREHGSYVESYDCNCRTVTTTSGSGKNQTTSFKTVCDTCYRDHFTVKWDCQSNIGSWRIHSLDWTSRSVYDELDPARYTIIKKGDPVARQNSYTNYVKAVPESLFRPAAADLKAKYAGQIPAYPINVYDFYKVDRVLPVGVSVNTREWNDKLSVALKTLGPAKQANVVIVLTKIADPNYVYALQDAWAGGKKNDVIVVIGAPSFPQKAEWVRVLAFTDHDIFRVKLRDEILALEELTSDTVISTISSNVMTSFKRKSMKDFKYLENEIDPPEWVIISSLIAIILAYGIFWFAAHRSVYSGFSSVYNRNVRRFR